jgi:hypothetical protein
VKKSLFLICAILLGIFPPVSVNARASNCLSLSDEMLTPMSFTVSEWTSNGITKEYVDSSYRAFGRFGVEPWVKNSNYLPSSLLEKLNVIPANEKNVEVWFEKSSGENFQDVKRIRWAEFPSVYKPYLEVDTIIDADAGDWLRFVASIQIKDCGPPKVLRSRAAQYPIGKLPLVSLEVLKSLKTGTASASDSKLINFDQNGISPWHFLTVDSLDRNMQILKNEFGEARETGERFLVPSLLGTQNQLRLTIRPISPTDCLGFEFRNLRYTNDGWDVSFSKLPCTVSVSAELPAKLFSGPPLIGSPTSSFNLDCFTCSTNVLIYKTTVYPISAQPTSSATPSPTPSPNNRKEEVLSANAELKAKLDAEAKAAAELKAKLDAEAKAAVAKATANKRTSITCVKGKLTKKVTAVKPKCPAGYKVTK